MNRIYFCFLIVGFAISSTAFTQAQSARAGDRLTNMTNAAIQRACRNAADDGAAASAKNLTATIKCYSIASHLNACETIALQTQVVLDKQRSGEETFQELRQDADNASGSEAVYLSDAVTLSQAAIHSESSGHFAMTVYQRCVSSLRPF